MSNESLSQKISSEEEVEKNTPLSDEELSRLIQASRDEKFVAKEIKNKTTDDFIKVSLHDIAKKYSKEIQPKEKDSNKNKLENTEIQDTNNEIKEDKNEIKEDKANTASDKKDKEEGLSNTDNDTIKKEDQNNNNLEENKIIQEDEHLKIIESTKKESFEKGKEKAYSEVKEGADVAIAKLNSISDKIAKTDQLDLAELESLISNKILNLSSELTGKIIKAIPTEFLKKIKNFVSTLENNDGEIEIFISEDDYKVLEKNKDIKGKLKEMNIANKAGLLNGEVELLVNGIRIKQKLES